VIRVLLAAPSPALRAGLRALLASDPRVDVIGESARLVDLDKVETDVLILTSASLASTFAPGFALPEATAILLLSDSPLPAADALRARAAWGILPLEASADELLAAVHALAQGLVVGTRALLDPPLSDDALSVSARGPLTERETEVLTLLSTGLANKQIAAALGISEHTVKFHVSSIYTKLNATNRTEAVRAGLRGGWITL
jgi:DNA-binding NarL/FixJ family response regulator